MFESPVRAKQQFVGIQEFHFDCTLSQFYQCRPFRAWWWLYNGIPRAALTAKTPFRCALGWFVSAFQAFIDLSFPLGVLGRLCGRTSSLSPAYASGPAKIPGHPKTEASATHRKKKRISLRTTPSIRRIGKSLPIGENPLYILPIIVLVETGLFCILRETPPKFQWRMNLRQRPLS
jgi:hypothetical protein